VFNIETTDFTVTIDGTGSIEAGGIAENFSINVIGSGNIFGFPLLTQFCNVEVEGSGNVEVTVAQELEVNISGSGNVSYQGDPDIDANISGSGTLIDAN